MKLKLSILLQLVFILGSTATIAAPPRNFLFISSDELVSLSHLIKRDDIEGVQIVYNWRQLESSKGNYDFSAIENDLKILNVFIKSCSYSYKTAHLTLKTVTYQPTSLKNPSIRVA